jgi:C-terminal processing protease CtpA/Prc
MNDRSTMKFKLKLTAALKKNQGSRLEALGVMPDEKIDYSDIPR